MKMKNIMVIAAILFITIIMAGCQSSEEKIIEAEKNLADMQTFKMETYDGGYKYNSELVVEEFDKKNSVLNIYTLDSENYKDLFEIYKPRGKEYKGIQISKRINYLEMEKDGVLEEIESEELFENFSSDPKFEEFFKENKNLFQKTNTIDYKVPTLEELEK